ncbi:flippase-like domain-containing protein [candidate division KSB1 bacterium]|nr:flippase-like domain-containing protein [candidate division KSB1 bacterium]
MKFAITAPGESKFIINQKWLIALKISIAALLLFVLVRNIQLQTIREALFKADFLFIASAVLLLIPNFFIQGLKWHYLLKLSKPAATYVEALKSLLAGFALGFVTPGRVGEFGRAIFVKDSNRLQVVGLTMIDKLFSMLIILMLGAFAIFFFFGIWMHSKLTPVFALVSLAASLITSLIVLFPDGMKKAGFKILPRLPFTEKIELILSGLNGFHRNQALFLLALNFLFYAIYLTQFYLLLSAFDVFSPVEGYIILSSTIFAKSLLPISFGDLGIRESAAVYFVTHIGGEESTAFNASILMFLINIVLPSLIGFGLVMGEKVNGQLHRKGADSEVRTR